MRSSNGQPWASVFFCGVGNGRRRVANGHVDETGVGICLADSKINSSDPTRPLCHLDREVH